MRLFTYTLLLIAVFACSNETPFIPKEDDNEDKLTFYGADLSYVNEMEDCGATYKDADGNTKDPYEIFSEEGTNLVRLRLWHNPT